jgi:hypothetical protein
MFPYVVIKQYIGTFVKLWDYPSHQLFESAKRELNARLRSLIEDHFSQYTHGHLKQRITYASCSSLQRFHFAYNRSGVFCKTTWINVPMLRHNTSIH